MTLYRALEERWQHASVALIFEDQEWSYAELMARVRRAAGWCHAQGLAPGDVLALQLPKSLPWLELHLGALSQGITTLPLHPDAPRSEADAICRDAGADIHVNDLDGLRAQLDQSESLEPRHVAAHHVAVLLYTSGTTGRPKGVPLTHENLLAGVHSLHEEWRWSREDVLLHALPLFHVHGLFVAQYGALFAGATTRWMARFDAEAVLDTLPTCSVFMGVPTFYRRLLNRGPRSVALSNMRLFTSGSAPLPAADHEAFHANFGHRILERYGMTEIGIVLSNPYDAERRPGTVGFPLPHVTANIVDASGGTCPPDTIGQLVIQGSSVFSGYLNRPQATRTTLIDGWMQTGDLASISDDGYISIVGRAKDLVISGGFNIYPREVESKLCALDGVIEAAVFGVPDTDLGERVAVALVTENGTWNPVEWKRALQDQIARYKIPRRWFRMEALPRNTMGKVGKASLRSRYGVRVEPATLDDLETIVRFNRSLCDATESFSLDEHTVRLGVSKVLNDSSRGIYRMARIDGTIAGQMLVTREWSDWRDAWVWWIQSVWVDPEFRRRGVYQALHETVRQEARRAGVAGLRLYVETDNVGAQTTYRRVGMQTGHYNLFEEML